MPSFPVATGSATNDNGGMDMGKGKAKGPTRVREAIRKAKKDGWQQKRRTGTNHRQYKHPFKKGTVTIAGNPGDELDRDTLQSIKDQMKVSDEKWDDL